MANFGYTGSLKTTIDNLIAGREPKVSFRPESYGAVGDGTTDDSAAWSAAISAAATFIGGSSSNVVVRGKIGTTYAMANPAIVQSNVTLDLRGSSFTSTNSTYPKIVAGSSPAVPAATDKAGQVGGSCFTDALANDGASAIYNLRVLGGRFVNFRYGFVSQGFAWNGTTWTDTFFENCNIGIFAYQGCQEPKLYNVTSGGGASGTTFVAAATAFPAGHPNASRDNFFCDGLVYDCASTARDQSILNPAFDTWFQNAILRPTTDSVVTGGTYQFDYSAVNASALGVSGRNIYVPSRNKRGIFGFQVRRGHSVNCARGFAVVGNPINCAIDNVGGEGLFQPAPDSMVLILITNGYPGSGVLSNIDASSTTYTAKSAVEISKLLGYEADPKLTAIGITGPIIGTGIAQAVRTLKPGLSQIGVTGVAVAGVHQTYNMTSVTRTATVTSGSATVADTASSLADRGRPVTGTGIPAGTVIGTVVVGTSFNLVTPAFGGTAVNATAAGTSVTIGGSMNLTLTPLSTTVDDDYMVIEKDAADSTTAILTVIPTAGDALASGAANVALVAAGEKIKIQAATINGTRVWRVMDHTMSRIGLDARYASIGVSAGASVASVFAERRRGASALQGVPISNNALLGTNYTSTAVGTYRTPIKIATAASDVRLVFRNWGQNLSSPYGDTDGTGVMTLNVSVEAPSNSSVLMRVTFGGAATATLGAGGTITSDPLGFELAAGSVLWTRQYVSSTGTYYTNRNTGGASGGGGFTATNDLTAAGSAAIANSNADLYGPIAILGNTDTTSKPALTGIGDSIIFGQGDTQSYTACGWFERSFFGVRPTLNLGKASEAAFQFVTDYNHFRRGGFIAYGAAVVEAYGENDFNLQGRTGAQIIASKVATWSLLTQRGVRYIASATITPSTTSTDSWATTANQTLLTSNRDANRVAANQWLRAGAPMSAGAAVAVGTSGAVTCDVYGPTGTKILTGTGGHPVNFVIDNSGILETATDSGLWKVNGSANYYTADGTHPTPAAHAAIAAVQGPLLLSLMV